MVIAQFCSESGVSDDQPRSLAAVFDGHKRAEAAVIASELLPKLLAECGPGLDLCLACILACGSALLEQQWPVVAAVRCVVIASERVKSRSEGCQRTLDLVLCQSPKTVVIRLKTL